MVTQRKPSPLPAPARPLLALGLEGSANKLGVGLILHSPPADADNATPTAIGDLATTSILSNIRHTYVTPPGEGFLPSDTARHHKRWAADVVDKALAEAEKTMNDVDVVCFTKGEVSARQSCGLARRADHPGMQVPAWVLRCRPSLSSLGLSP